MEEEERAEKGTNRVTNVVWSWGAGTDGQLATTNLQDEHLPQLVSSLSFTSKPISHLACGGAHVVALTKDDGKVLTWGRGTSGQLGHGDINNCSHPTQVKSLESFVITQVSAGWNHSGFVSNDGRAFTCGDGAFGQLGHGDYQSQCLPVQVLYLGSKHVEHIACGMRHTLVLLKGQSGNQIYGFGSGKRGQLGVSKDLNRRLFNLPQIVPGFEEVEIATVIANGDQSAALTVDGNLYTWGKGFQGRSDDHHPLLVSSPWKIKKVSLGWNHALILIEYGKVFMLGGNHHGMLSGPLKTSLNKCSSNQSTLLQGSKDDSKVPTLQEVPGLDGITVVDIAAGAEHSAIVTEDGKIMTWGWGEHGQLGLGDEKDQVTPNTNIKEGLALGLLKQDRVENHGFINGSLHGAESFGGHCCTRGVGLGGKNATREFSIPRINLCRTRWKQQKN